MKLFGDFNQRLDYEREIFEGFGYNFDFLGVISIQKN